MEPTVSLEVDDEIWRSGRWYRALSLAERREAATSGNTSLRAVPPEMAERAARRLETWRAQEPFGRDGVFARRLAVDALSEPELLSILAETGEEIQARSAALPDWLTALRDTLDCPPAAGVIRPLLDQVAVDHPLAPFLPALAPILYRGLSTVHTRAATLHKQYQAAPFDVETLTLAFLTNLAPDILYQLSKPLLLEMHIARLQGRLSGATPEARFDDYVRQMTEERGIVALLEKYPVLARQLVTTVDLWADYLGELLTHLCIDWETICVMFAGRDDPGQLVELRAGMGDRHRGGRSVILLRFRSGLRLLHKPKSLAVDTHFQDLLVWLNERVADPPFRPLQLLDRGTYGWSEFVEAVPCASAAEVERFYRRQGSFLALLYVLGGVDLHNENVIAAGEHPVFIDLEALFHPHIHANDPILAQNFAAREMDRSVWQVGLLPRRLWSGKDSAGVDTSGLGGAEGQTLPHPLVRWQDAGTDRMRITREYVDMPPGENRPRLGAEPVDALAYGDAVVAGFTQMYRLLWRDRDDVLDEVLPRFARDEIRAVLRSTNIYATLLYESFHPDLLRDALERERFFDRLWIEAVDRPYLERIAGAERRDLWRGDIPVFTTTPASRAVVTADGESIPDFFTTPSMDLARECLGRLSEHDLARQIWIIEASLATLLMDREDVMGQPISFEPSARPVTRQQLLDLAASVGRRLDELAMGNDSAAHWLGVGPLDEYIWGVFPAGTDLYSGTTGIALFLAYLGTVTEEPAYSSLARRALASLQRQIAQPEQFAARANVGAFDGLASLIYLFTHLAVLWGDPSLLRSAEELVEQLPPRIAADDRFDIVYGSAGCLLSLLALQTVQPTARTLEIALHCGDRLLAAAQPLSPGLGWTTLKDQPPLGGFSHGASGIAHSLLKLAAASGNERFRSAALEALAFDRSLFVSVLGNWADRRVFPARGRGASYPASGEKSMVAWCHGAAGIGLGRLGTLAEMDNDPVRQEIDTALATTIEHGFVSNHSLCHGALGNIELLLAAAELLNREEDHAALGNATARVVGSIERHGMVTGVPLGVETPGLMTGLAGIGYQLLRLAEPTRVPSVLLLSPPLTARGCLAGKA